MLGAIVKPGGAAFALVQAISAYQQPDMHRRESGCFCPANARQQSGSLHRVEAACRHSLRDHPMTNNALATHNRNQILTLAAELDALNNLGCPLN